MWKNRFNLTRWQTKSTLIAVFLGALAFAAVPSQGGRGGGASKDRAREASAADPEGVTSNVSPVIGSSNEAQAISPQTAKSLLAEFQHAQSAEAKALDHRNRMELAELKASQSARQKDWERHEKDARHHYFAQHTSGPERRAYIKDFLERRRTFMQNLSDESKRRVREQSDRSTNLHGDQAERLQQFKAALAKGQRPDTKLWPGTS